MLINAYKDVYPLFNHEAAEMASQLLGIVYWESSVEENFHESPSSM